MTASREADRSVVHGYMTGISVAGLLVLAVTAALQLTDVPWASHAMWPCYTLAAVLVACELRPLLLPRGDGVTDRVTTSSTAALALVLTGPLLVALVAQGAAVLADDIRRRAPRRALFNLGQYLLALVAARTVYATAAGTDIFATATPVRADELVPALLAGVAFFGVNNLAVAVVISLHTGADMVTILREDVRAQGLAAGILLGLGPVAALVVTQAPAMLPLLLLPLVGVHRSAWITARRQHEAMHDALTGLPNRTLFQRLTAQAITDESEAGGSLGVVLLDLDHFREVNDTLGHQVGDDVLLEVTRRVTAALPAGLTVARLGGDEFAVLVSGDEPAVAALARLLATRLREPVVTENARMGVQASIGIALFPDHARDADTLLKRADIALYRAKRTRGEIETYRPEIDEHTVLRLNLLGDLHKAVDNEEFELMFQPQVDGLHGEVVGIEALMRWRHPDYGTISPEIFIPLAENTGLIGSLSRRALENAVTTLGLLRTAGHDLSMAVNVSARTLSDLDLPRWISRALLVSSVPPSRLTIEVTESTITADPQRAIQVLHELRELGVLLSVDDFGTGYSSLSYLRQLQPDELKIDRSFVAALCRDGDSAVIVRSTVELGHALGLDVVAEGVEDQDTYDALVGMGCDRMQGFHIAQPMSPAALKAWLDTAAIHGGPVPAVPTPPVADPVPAQRQSPEPVTPARGSLPSPAA
jgi:diguanylate cyclase (GGDEF)-like protein